MGDRERESESSCGHPATYSPSVKRNEMRYAMQSLLCPMPKHTPSKAMDTFWLNLQRKTNGAFGWNIRLQCAAVESLMLVGIGCWNLPFKAIKLISITSWCDWCVGRTPFNIDNITSPFTGALVFSLRHLSWSHFSCNYDPISFLPEWTIALLPNFHSFSSTMCVNSSFAIHRNIWRCIDSCLNLFDDDVRIFALNFHKRRGVGAA